MSPIQELERKIKDRFGDAVVRLDRPVQDGGTWSLDVDLADQSLTIEWRPDKGFGVSSLNESTFGEGHDEIYPDLASTWARTKSLLLSKRRTEPPDHLQLRALREQLEVSQVALAERLDVGQAAVSKLERRSDMLLSTLESVVSALGGRLEIIADFPKRSMRLFTSERSQAGAKRKTQRSSLKAR